MPNIKTFNKTQQHRLKQLDYDISSLEKEIVNHCDLCGGDVFTIIAHHDRYHHETKTMLCECGNVFLSPRLTKSASSELYSGLYRQLISAWHGRDISAEAVQEDQKIYANELLSLFDSTDIVKKSNIGSILDVGGSTGTILKEIEKWVGSTCRLVNIDPSLHETAISKSKGVETLRGFIEDINIDEKFDLVVMTWAVDHLTNISQSFSKIRDVMKDDGFFWVDAMDFKKQISKMRSIEGAVKIDHNFYFTNTVLEQYLKKAGLNIKLVAVSRDKWHMGYLCGKGVPQDIDVDLLKQEKKNFYEFTRSIPEIVFDDRFV